MEKIWNAALYIRLSQDDADRSMSNSVINQKDMLEHYALKDSSIKIFDKFIDDGFTGTNFNRPAFLSMMDAVKSGSADCIIIKDLSRFGRDHIEVDNYLERIFPAMNIRFISINEQIDSYRNPKKMESIEIPFLNLLNEEYAKDISRKTNSSLETKRKQGKYVGVHVPYGYLRDTKDNNKLLLDKNVANNVVNIFNWYISGLSQKKIASNLNNMKVKSPSLYKREMGIRKMNSSSSGLWTSSMVGKILACDLYTGDMIQGKTAKLSHKLKQRKSLPRDQWIIVRSTHHAIISHQVSETAQNLLSRSAKPKCLSNASPLARYVKCGDCGKTMIRNTVVSNGKEYKRFVCSTSKKLGVKACSTHIIGEKILIEIMLKSIQSQIKFAVDIDRLIKRTSESKFVHKEKLYLESKKDKLQNEANRIKIIKQGLYDDYKIYLLTYDEYVNMKEYYSRLYDETELKIQSINFELAKLSNKPAAENESISKYLEFKDSNDITRELIVSLIEEILILDGKKIEIKFKFIDEFKKYQSMFAIQLNS